MTTTETAEATESSQAPDNHDIADLRHEIDRLDADDPRGSPAPHRGLPADRQGAHGLRRHPPGAQPGDEGHRALQRAGRRGQEPGDAAAPPGPRPPRSLANCGSGLAGSAQQTVLRNLEHFLAGVRVARLGGDRDCSCVVPALYFSRLMTWSSRRSETIPRCVAICRSSITTLWGDHTVLATASAPARRRPPSSPELSPSTWLGRRRHSMRRSITDAFPTD